MNKSLVFAIILLTAIVLMASFDLQFGQPDAIVRVPADMLGNVLYVCPAANSTWDSIAHALHQQNFPKYIMVGFFFAAMILMFVWGWSLYQNLLSDKFKKDTFKKPWDFTKLLFWAGVIILILMHTPNYYRKVHVKGSNAEWVLCENNSPNARAVRATAVTR